METLTQQKVIDIYSLRNKGLSFREIGYTIGLPLSSIQYSLNKGNKNQE